MEKFVNYLFKLNHYDFSERDEYQQQMIYQIYAKSSILTSYILGVLLILVNIFSYYLGQFNIALVVGIPVIIKLLYESMMMNKYKLIKMVYYNKIAYQQAITKLQHRIVSGGMIFFAVTFINIPHVPWQMSLPVSIIVTMIISTISYRDQKKNIKLLEKKKGKMHNGQIN